MISFFLSALFMQTTITLPPKEIVSTPTVVKNIASEKTQDLGIERLMRRELGAFYNRNNYQMVSRWANYQYNLVDLNGDKTPEALVYLTGAQQCGTGGCSAFILKQNNKKWKIMTRLSLVKETIGVSENENKGWRNLILRVSGGGLPSQWKVLKFDGKNYPSNPSVSPAEVLKAQPKVIFYWQKGPAFKVRPR